MIRYALVCEDDHRFEAWFSSSDAYDTQAGRGLVECPQCGSVRVKKQVMAPAIATSSGRETVTGGSAGGPESVSPDDLVRKVQAHIRANYDYVGERFADEARAIHNGEKAERLIYGETTHDERARLSEEGVACAPLPDAFVPPSGKKTN